MNRDASALDGFNDAAVLCSEKSLVRDGLEQEFTEERGRMLRRAHSIEHARGARVVDDHGIRDGIELARRPRWVSNCEFSCRTQD